MWRRNEWAFYFIYSFIYHDAYSCQKGRKRWNGWTTRINKGRLTRGAEGGGQQLHFRRRNLIHFNLWNQFFKPIDLSRRFIKSILSFLGWIFLLFFCFFYFWEVLLRYIVKEESETAQLMMKVRRNRSSSSEPRKHIRANSPRHIQSAFKIYIPCNREKKKKKKIFKSVLK